VSQLKTNKEHFKNEQRAGAQLKWCDACLEAQCPEFKPYYHKRKEVKDKT
jgi:hypothetical protein